MKHCVACFGLVGGPPFKMLLKCGATRTENYQVTCLILGWCLTRYSYLLYECPQALILDWPFIEIQLTVCYDLWMCTWEPSSKKKQHILCFRQEKAFNSINSWPLQGALATIFRKGHVIGVFQSHDTPLVPQGPPGGGIQIIQSYF